MNRSDVQTIRTGFEISHHTFVNRISDGIKDSLIREVPELEVRVGGKIETGNGVELTIYGNMPTATDNDYTDTKNAVESVINKLKNPAVLLALLTKNAAT